MRNKRNQFIPKTKVFKHNMKCNLLVKSLKNIQYALKLH